MIRYILTLSLLFVVFISNSYAKSNNQAEQSINTLLRTDLYNKADAYDASHVLMIPMFDAFLEGNTQKMKIFRVFFSRFSKEHKKDLNLNTLTTLQFLYWASWYLVLEKSINKGSNIELEYMILKYLEKVWNSPAWQWKVCGKISFPSIKERIEYKISDEKSARSYCKAIIDEELFIFGIAGNLRFLGWNTKSIKESLDLAFKVFNKKIRRFKNGRWIFQPKVWRDHPDYKYACYDNKSKKFISCNNIAPDISHSQILPLILLSLKISSNNKSAYYYSLLNGLTKQFLEKVIVKPDKNYKNYRVKNYLDGKNGYFRKKYKTNSEGYGPYELSGSILYGWWSLLPDEKINKIYCYIYDKFPLSQKGLELYSKAFQTMRKRNPIIINGYLLFNFNSLYQKIHVLCE